MLADWIKERHNIEGLHRERFSKPEHNLTCLQTISNNLLDLLVNY